MSAELYEGQRVICIGRCFGTTPMNGEIEPTIGEVYTIRKIIPKEEIEACQDGLFLKEIVNPVIPYYSGLLTMECPMASSRFTPVRYTKEQITRTADNKIGEDA